LPPESFDTTTRFTPPTPLQDDGLICGFHLPRDGPLREIRFSEVSEALEEPGSVTWLHFNLAHAGTWRRITHAQLLPENLCETIERHDERCRIEPAGDGLIAVIHDLTFEKDSDPSEVATLWLYATQCLLISARRHTLKTADDLRSAVRGGLRAESGIDLMAQLFELRMEALRQLVEEINEQVDDVEDQVLRGRVTEQREELGRIRRICARLRRSFAPERVALQRMLGRPHSALGERVSGWLRSVSDDLAFLTDEVTALQERAKLLQEELAARVAEDAGSKLNVLTALTAVFLPMTLISGIFGMNVAGLPGTAESATAEAFWWTMLLIVAAGAVTLGVLFGKKLL